jgi:hypothetical protein
MPVLSSAPRCATTLGGTCFRRKMKMMTTRWRKREAQESGPDAKRHAVKTSASGFAALDNSVIDAPRHYLWKRAVGHCPQSTAVVPDH